MSDIWLHQFLPLFLVFSSSEWKVASGGSVFKDLGYFCCACDGSASLRQCNAEKKCKTRFGRTLNYLQCRTCFFTSLLEQDDCLCTLRAEVPFVESVKALKLFTGLLCKNGRPQHEDGQCGIE